jgi:DNA polymerase-3 subunit delta
MARINHSKVEELLDAIRKGNVSPVYLLYGDEFLYKSVFKAITDCLIPRSDRVLNYEVIEGHSENVHDTIEELNTFPMIPARKVVAVRESRIFVSKKDAGAILTRSLTAFDEKKYRKAALDFLQALALTGWSLEDVTGGAWRNISDSEWRKRFGFDRDSEKLGWIDDVVRYVLDHDVCLPSVEDDSLILEELLKKGLPSKNILVLTTSFVDKRRTLFKTIEKIGTVIDCSIPSGTGKADRKRQFDLFRLKTEAILKKQGKSMDHAALSALLDRTGYDLRRFAGELEKLIDYAGKRKKITALDVGKVSERTREDPLYELGNLIGKKDATEAIAVLHNLLENDCHPLQILASIATHVRKLILARDFVHNDSGRTWNPGMRYPAFQSIVCPEIKKRAADGFMAKSHPFVLYNTFLQAEKFELAELLHAISLLVDADSDLKTSPRSPVIVLEQVILRISKGRKDRKTP